MPQIHRRNLVKLAGALPVLGSGASAATPPRIVAIIEPGNAVATSPPVARALDKLRHAMGAHGAGLEIGGTSAGAALALIVAASDGALAAGFAPGMMGALVRRSANFFHSEKNTGVWPDRHAHYWLRPEPRWREAEARQEGG